MAQDSSSRHSRPPFINRRTWLWALAVFVLTFAGATGALVILMPPPKQSTSPFRSVASVVTAVANAAVSPDLVFRDKDYVTVLLIGRDVDRDRRGRVMNTYGRSDTIMVCYLDRMARKVNILSIPRDTFMRIPHAGVMLVNAAHSLGGPQRLIDTLDDNLCLEIDHWVRVNFEGSKKIIDAMGGVVVDVEKDMHYDDNWGHLHINLKKGRQVLDGDKAHQYLRFRKDREGDIGRIRRQQKLMRAVAHQLLRPRKLLKLPAVLKAIKQVVDTDLTDAEVMSLAAFMRKLNPDNVTTATLPGYPRNGHWLMAPAKAEDVLQSMMGEAFNHVRWRNSARTRYATLPVPSRPVVDPKPVVVTEESPAEGGAQPPAGTAAAPVPVSVQPRPPRTSRTESGTVVSGASVDSPGSKPTTETAVKTTEPVVPPLGAAKPLPPPDVPPSGRRLPVPPASGNAPLPLQTRTDQVPGGPSPTVGKTTPPLKTTPDLDPQSPFSNAAKSRPPEQPLSPLSGSADGSPADE